MAPTREGDYGCGGVWRGRTDGDMSDWMAELPACLPLTAVTLPGTHNSGSFAVDVPGRLKALVSATRCQALDLGMQLRMGVRFLDLRVRPDGWLCHGRVPCAITLAESLRICSDFLSAHRGEMLLVRVKDESGRSSSAADVSKLMRSLAESAEYPLCVQMRLPSKLADARGRIVLLCDWADGELGVRWGGESMAIQDEYWQSTGTKKWHVTRQFLAASRLSRDLLQVHFTSATYLPKKTPATIARTVNPKLAEYLRCGLACRAPFLGVIAMDFPSAALCRLVLRRNWPGLDPRRSLTLTLNDGIDFHDWIENLSCELQAATARADIERDRWATICRAGSCCNEAIEDNGNHELVDEEPYAFASRRVAHIYVKLLFERAKIDVQEPALEEGRRTRAMSPDFNESEHGSSGGVATVDGMMAEGCGVGGADRVGCNSKPNMDDAAVLPARQIAVGSGRGYSATRFLYRFGAKCVGALPALRRTDGSSSRKDSTNASASAWVDPLIPEPCSQDFMDNLECELVAAASRADAAAMGRPEELVERVEWLARVLVRLTQERAWAASVYGAPLPRVSDTEEGEEEEEEEVELVGSFAMDDLFCGLSPITVR
eukprot:TRINITY_DN25794_c0_g1_i1.p1 TRINITY_DN25794_c0_g1~~TRINITY_DN25794_c0_g1_i1.p1  ORF type:complete len:603 (+),score=85.63 TRINITY_DN25794_c0_g1_i1:125-1933(+)